MIFVCCGYNVHNAPDTFLWKLEQIRFLLKEELVLVSGVLLHPPEVGSMVNSKG